MGYGATSRTPECTGLCSIRQGTQSRARPPRKRAPSQRAHRVVQAPGSRLALHMHLKFLKAMHNDFPLRDFLLVALSIRPGKISFEHNPLLVFGGEAISLLDAASLVLL